MPTRGIWQRRRPNPTSARPMVRRPSCACRAVSTSTGSTTTRCNSMPIPARRRARSGRRRPRHQDRPRRSRATPSASWEFLGRARPRRPGPEGDGPAASADEEMSGGYLRRNGVPYSENASLEEDFDTFTEPNGDTWLVVTSIVTDPRYLTGRTRRRSPSKKFPISPGMGSHALQGGGATLIGRARCRGSS